ncbi:MAG: NAD(P)-dependent oxidoreductase, partial [Candidatus Bathyarchaeia archaeon]
MIPEAISPDRTRVGWIGTGVMGKPMCGHILRAGYRVTLYNRTKAKAEELIARGAKWAGSPREVAEEADVIFTMVGYPEDVREVYLGPNGILAGAKRGSIMIDMSTSQPSLAVEIYSKAKAIGAHALDAPVSGGDIGAREGTLSIMIGGDRDIAERVKPLFQLMGKSIRYMGPAGSGQSAKLCNQI